MPDNFNFLLFSQPFYCPPYNHHPHHGEYNPFQNLFMKQNNEDKTQQSSLFPLNINKMHVSLSGSSDGVSLTIETHQGQNKNQQNPPPRNSTETSQVFKKNASHLFRQCANSIYRNIVCPSVSQLVRIRKNCVLP